MWFRKPNSISVFKQCQSNTQMSGFFCFIGKGGGVGGRGRGKHETHKGKPTFGESRFFGEKKAS